MDAVTVVAESLAREGFSADDRTLDALASAYSARQHGLARLQEWLRRLDDAARPHVAPEQA
jgi:hypothetical protein